MEKEVILSNKIKMPVLAYGTWLIDDSIAADCVKTALEVGYRHVDTAQAYGNEVGVGKGIKLSGLNRKEIFVTTKVMAELKTYKDAKRSIDESLKRLDLDYVDLILIHCPQPWREFGQPYRYEKENLEVWKALIEAYKEGKTRAIGVSNFTISDIENISKNSEVKPMVNQVFCCVGNTPHDLIKYCKDNNIIVESYSPIAHGNALKSEKLLEIANKYKVSVAQLCIKYTLQLGTVSIPKATSRKHIEDDFKLDFVISNDDMEILKNFDEKFARY